MITLYGIEWSRANYVLFTLEELDLEYRHIKTNPFEEAKNTPEYLNLNPLAQVPTLVDGNFVLTESMAINFYLVKKYGADKLWFDQLENEAYIYKWTFFAVSQLETSCVNIVIQNVMTAEKDRDLEQLKQSEQNLKKPLSVLDVYLAEKDFLVADQFSVADINLASVLSYARNGHFDFSIYKNVLRYLDNILSRPARMKISLN